MAWAGKDICDSTLRFTLKQTFISKHQQKRNISGLTRKIDRQFFFFELRLSIESIMSYQTTNPGVNFPIE